MAWWRTVGAAASRKSVLIAVAIGLLYFWWVTTQYERINRFNQRQLASAALVLRATIDTAVTNVRNYKYDGNYKSDETRTIPLLKGRDEEPALNQVCTFDTRQPYLSLDDCGHYADYTGTFDSPRFSSDTLSVVASRTDSTKAPITFHLQLASVFEEMAFTDTFDLVFVINGAGTVRYQLNPTARRWQNRLRWGERTFRDEAASQIAGTQIQDVAQLLGADAWKNAGSVSSRTAVTLGGETAVLYLQPVPLGAIATEGTIVLGAVVPSRDVVWRALAMDTYFVALLFCLLLFAVLGIPFIKLATLHAHERVTLRDVRNLYVSAAGLLAVWIFAALAIDHYVRWQSTADAGLRAFAADLRGQVEAEIKDAVQTLDRYDDTVLQKRNALFARGMFTDWFNRTRTFLPTCGRRTRNRPTPTSISAPASTSSARSGSRRRASRCGRSPPTRPTGRCL